MTDVGFRNQVRRSAAASPAGWLPGDVGLLCANYDLPAATSAQALTKGTLYLTRLPIRAAITLSKLWFGAGGSASGAQDVRAGVYSQAGNLLSDCGAVGAQFVLTTFAQCTLTTPQALATWVWAALLSNMGGAQAAPRATSTAGAASYSLALAAAQLLFAVNGTGLASLPASITPASNTTNSSLPIWVGGS